MTEREQALITKYDLLFESRLAKTEQSLINLDRTCADLRETCKEIKTDLRWMLGIWIGVNSLMLSLMAKGFHWLN